MILILCISNPQGLSSLGQPSLTDGEFSALCTRYADPKHKGNVLWKRFIADIDQGGQFHYFVVLWDVETHCV